MADDARAKIWRVGIRRMQDEVDCTWLFLTPIAAAREVVGEILPEQSLRDARKNQWSNNSRALRMNSSWVSRRPGSKRRSNTPTAWPALARSGAGEGVVAGATDDDIGAGFDT